MHIEDIVFVLSRPSEPGNTGAVCRAMKNMGFRQLRIAASELSDFDKNGSDKNGSAKNGLPSAWEDKLLARAIHAADVWENAEHFDSLKAALADCAISIGTSRRRGRKRKSCSLTPRELAAFLKNKNGKAALVFGNEQAGLSGEELGLCNTVSHILVDPGFPSINLSHAVQIYAYELYQTLTDEISVPGQWVPMTSAEIDSLVNGISSSLASIGFYKNPGKEEQERFLRDLMARAGLSLKEGRYLSNIIAKAGRLLSV